MQTTTEVPRSFVQDRPTAQEPARPGDAGGIKAPADVHAIATAHVDATVAKFHDLPLMLTVEETARVLRIGRNGAYEAVASGAIPSIRIGRKIRVPRKALAAWIDDTGDDGHVDPTTVPPGEDTAAPRGASLGGDAERTPQ